MPRIFLVLALIVCQISCSRNSTVAVTQTSEQDFQLGREAFEKKDYEQAAKLFDDALRHKGLNADLAAEALLMRAKSCIKLGRVNEALHDLEDAANGPVPVDEVLAAKAEIAWLQEDPQRAKELYNEARRINPAIKIPEKISK